jgi:hypothetical protein
MPNIIGLPRWDNPDAYYSQTNNVVETILAKTKADRKLESCGPTAAVCILDALGALGQVMTPGGWIPQPEDLLAAWMNDPRNYDAMRRFRSDIDPSSIMGNEVPQWYEAAIPAVFGVKARFYWGSGQPEISQALRNGRGVLITLQTPGHYVGIVADDVDARQFVYHDPWPGNSWPYAMAGKPGRCRRVGYAELSTNIKVYRVEIGA